MFVFVKSTIFRLSGITLPPFASALTRWAVPEISLPCWILLETSEYFRRKGRADF